MPLLPLDPLLYQVCPLQNFHHPLDHDRAFLLDLLRRQTYHR